MVNHGRISCGGAAIGQNWAIYEEGRSGLEETPGNLRLIVELSSVDPSAAQEVSTISILMTVEAAFDTMCPELKSR